MSASLTGKTIGPHTASPKLARLARN